MGLGAGCERRPAHEEEREQSDGRGPQGTDAAGSGGWFGAVHLGSPRPGGRRPARTSC